MTVNKQRRGIRVKNKRLIIAIAVILLVIIIIFIFKDKILKIIYPKPYKEIVSTYAEKYNVEENLIFAVMKAESNFDENAVSHKSAIGLMQIMEETADDITTKYGIDIDKENIRQEVADIQNNINIGTKYLSVLLETYGNKEIAVPAYNAGIGNVDKWISQGQITEELNTTNIELRFRGTTRYLKKVIHNYKMYKVIYPKLNE